MDFTIDDSQQQTSAADREITPAGTHEMTIRHAEEGPNEYKITDTNPDGMCLKLRLSTTSGNYRFVFDDIPKHLGWRAKQLADAVGLAADGSKVSLDPASLVGATLTVEVSHYTSKTGKVSAVVKKYVAASKPAAAPYSKPRVSSAKLPIPGDDIPF